MPLVPMRQILDEAAKGGYGVGAFNVSNMEQIQAVMQAAHDTHSPVIIQASRGSLKYSRGVYLQKLMEAAAGECPHIPAALHLDHGNSVEACMQAIQLGFTSVMIDGMLAEDCRTLNPYPQNVAVTRKVAEVAHMFGVTVEGTLGITEGIEDGHGAGLSDAECQIQPFPERAAAFVQATGVDALVIPLNKSHSAYKPRRDPVTGETPELPQAMQWVHQVGRTLADCHLSIHGASSLAGEWFDTINACGGRLCHAAGITGGQVQDAIRRGVRKISVDTDCRLAMTGAVRRAFEDNPGGFDPRGYLSLARSAMHALCVERMRAFGQAGHASDYMPMTLPQAARLYG